MTAWLLGTLVPVLLIGSTASAGPAPAGRVFVAVDRTAVTTQLGRTFTIRTRIENRSDAPAEGLIAHLNILSLRDGVYVDPEDWSTSRTRYLADIPAGGSVATDWRLRAVNGGSFAVYIAVLPRSDGGVRPVTAPTVHVAVAERSTLNPDGILPLVVAVPATIGLLAFAAGLRRRRAATLR